MTNPEIRRTAVRTPRVHHLFQALAVINAVSLLLGVAFVFAGAATNMWNIFGILMLVALTLNLFVALHVRVPSWAAFGYLVFSMAAMLLVPVLNMGASWSVPHSRSTVAIAGMLILFALGLLQAVAGTGKPAETSRPGLPWKVLRWIVAVVLSLWLPLGIFLGYVLVDAPFRVSFLFSLIEVFIPELGVFFGLFFLTIGVFVVRLLTATGRRFRMAALGVSLALFVIFMLPFVSAPVMIKGADQTMSATFGDSFRTNSAFANPLFRQTRFSIPEYFFGTPTDGYTAQYDIVYYRGQQGIDKGLELKFDVYRPESRSDSLPGQNSILIRIHGGGWSSGDKGGMNFGEMNKYFARQGYVVFDIQYGLSTKTAMATETDRSGDFAIDDMVRHIGIFTTYLADHADEYGANLDSVFISGGSAGGHLTLAVGLGLANGRHPQLLDPRLKVKGLIPFYPANELAANTAIGGSKEWADANLQLDRHAPPVLIYQGTHDSITPTWIAGNVQKAYQANGLSGIAIIGLPFGTHGSDLYFSSHYNQAFLYYMERFMYQHK